MDYSHFKMDDKQLNCDWAELTLDFNVLNETRAGELLVYDTLSKSNYINLLLSVLKLNT